MKKLLFAVLLFAGLAVAAPVAQAGQFARVYNGRGVVYVHKSQLYSPYSYGYRNDGYRNYGHQNYRHNHYRSYAYQPYSYDYYRPSYVSYPYYSDYDSGCYRSSYHHHHHHHRPHISIAFGF